MGQHLDNVPDDMADPGQLTKGARLSVCRGERTAALLDIGHGLSPCGWERQEAF